MKTIDITQEAHQILSALSHFALKGVGIEAFEAVKKLEAWLATAVDKPQPLKDA